LNAYSAAAGDGSPSPRVEMPVVERF